MNLSSRYGSSEYSARAEELFALFVRRRATGEELDFEAFCAEHPEHADELDGLHADWDNLHGLLGRMGVLGQIAEESPAALELPSPGAAGPFVDEAEAPPATLPNARAAHPAQGARAAVLLFVLLAASGAAAGLGLLARREARAAEFLADHNRRLETEIFVLDGRLIDLEESRREAAERAADSERKQRELERLAAEETLRAEEEAQRAAELRRIADAHAQRAAEQEKLAQVRAREVEEETQRAAAQARVAEEEARRAEEQERRAAALEQAALLERRRAAAALLALANARLERGELAGARRILEGVEPDRRGFAWRHLEARLADAPRDTEGVGARMSPPPAVGAGEAQALFEALEPSPAGAPIAPSPAAGPALLASGSSEDGALVLLALSDGRILAVAPAPGQRDPSAGEGDAPAALELHRASPGIVGLTLTGGGRVLVLVDRDGSLRAIDLELDAERWRATGIVPGAPLASGTGLVAARLGPGTVGAWRLSDGLFLGALGRPGATLRGFAWTEGGELALDFADGGTRVGGPGAGAAPLACPADGLAFLGFDLGPALDAPAPSADSPCGELRAELSGDALLVRDPAGGAPILEFPLPAPVAGLAFSADGRHLAALLESGQAWVWSSEPAAVRALWTRPAPGNGVDSNHRPR